MPKIKYTDKTFRRLQKTIIHQANQIIEGYQAQNWTLTLRQLYYQFVSLDLLPMEWFDEEAGSTNNDKSYKKLGDVISNARDAGLIDWDAIVDRTRPTYGLNTWSSTGDFLNEVTQSFHLDKWANQRYRIYVWVEKEALVDVVARACNEIQVDYKACIGYMSSSAIWRSAQLARVVHHYDKQTPVFLHLGDHDPSGIDMSRDNLERLRLYSGLNNNLVLKRIALTMGQIEEYNPPPNPTKLKDSRARDYIAKYGRNSWELDALEPNILVELIQTEIKEFQDKDKWDELVEIEAEQRKKLTDLANRWEEE